MNSKFANELSLWGAMPETHLIAIATFGLGPTGLASIESIALMIVTENWIPFEHSFDAALLDALTRHRASFLKGLRYNLTAERPLASVVLREDGIARRVDQHRQRRNRTVEIVRDANLCGILFAQRKRCRRFPAAQI